MNFFFSTGGHAGTSIFDGVAHQLKASLFSEILQWFSVTNAEEGAAVGGICSAGAFGDTGDAGENLNFLFINLFLLFQFSTFMFCMLCGVGTEAVALVRLVDACLRHTVSVVGSSLASSGIGLNWQGLNSL